MPAANQTLKGVMKLYESNPANPPTIERVGLRRVRVLPADPATPYDNAPMAQKPRWLRPGNFLLLALGAAALLSISALLPVFQPGQVTEGRMVDSGKQACAQAEIEAAVIGGRLKVQGIVDPMSFGGTRNFRAVTYCAGKRKLQVWERRTSQGWVKTKVALLESKATSVD